MTAECLTVPQVVSRSGSADPAAVRDADWRFLLPVALPRRAALVGQEGSRAWAALAAVCKEVVTPGVGVAQRPEPFGVVVVEGGQLSSLDTGATLLEPGGFLVVLIDRRTPGLRRISGATVVRGLRRAGLTDVAAHWHYPSFERCRCIIPATDLRVGVRFLRRSGDKLILRLLAWALAMPLVRPLVRRLLPCITVIARKPDQDEGTAP